MEPSITTAGVVSESEAHERSRTLSVQRERGRERKRERESERKRGRIVWSATTTSAVYAAARRDSSLLGVYDRRVSAVRVRVTSAVFGLPRTRQPRRTFVRVEAERGLRDGGGKVEEKEGEASRGGFPFSYGRYIPTFSSSTYLVNSVTIRHFLFLAK
ncbi:hypothetical protein ALC60_09899 [Trachymyrmex zeteki]|uniref:Uncharacterized protein n=1 Tax=Mycetomoellerius zeteki TaxID=64791 RepID=A0A151WTP4_9HYME|nr:hypothetical protein ALC60_09899 [Trachymyrmex zeteki]